MMQRGDRALPMERLVGTLLHVRITGSIFHEQEPRRLCASALSFGHRNQYNWQDNGAPELSMPSLIHIATDCCIYIYIYRIVECQCLDMSISDINTKFLACLPR